MFWHLIAALIVLGIALYGMYRRIDVFSAMIGGAKEGLGVCSRILPALVPLLAAITMLKASGVLDAFSSLCAPLFDIIGIPPECAPLLIIRPFSGSGALAMGAGLISAYGPDSIVGRTPWAHRILVEEGYRYDSSVFPIHHDLHGNPEARAEIHRIETEAGPIWEFPPAVVRRFGQNLPTGGGGYFRFFPYRVTARWLRSINDGENRPFVFYVHPWEIDPGQPRIPNAPLKSRFRHYLNLHRTEARLLRLLRDFEFTTVADVLESPMEAHQGFRRN